MVEYYPIPRKTSQDSTNLVRKFSLEYSSATTCTGEEFGRETFWSGTLRSWKGRTHQKSTPKDSTFPIADGKVKLSGGDRDMRTPTLLRDHNSRRKSKKIYRRIRRVSTFTTSRLISRCREARDDFWSISGDFIYRHRVEPRVNLYMAREESFPIPLR